MHISSVICTHEENYSAATIYLLHLRAIVVYNTNVYCITICACCTAAGKNKWRQLYLQSMQRVGKGLVFSYRHQA